VLSLLLNQIRPFLSRQSLLALPETTNFNLMIVD
jgi:hypothetical protein